jgi:hypothetical protein
MEPDGLFLHSQLPVTSPFPEHLYPSPNGDSKETTWCFYFSGVFRLSEHNTNADSDCEFDVCSNPLQDYTPTELIVHKDYRKPRFKRISLIRLDRHVDFSSKLPVAVSTAFLFVAAVTAVSLLYVTFLCSQVT